MPNLSGLHMCRTISSGHSSLASRSIRTSSVNRFLPKSLSDFKLNFNVFAVIIGLVSPFANLGGQFRQKFQNIGGNPDIRDTEYRGFGVLIDGHDERIALEARQMLERAADAACQVHLGLDGLAGRSDLPRFLHPLGIHYGTRAAPLPILAMS